MFAYINQVKLKKNYQPNLSVTQDLLISISQSQVSYMDNEDTKRHYRATLTRNLIYKLAKKKN